MASKTTNCKYHTQDAGVFCGPACAMMVLAEMNPGSNPIDQDDLDVDIQEEVKRDPAWASDPDELTRTMSKRSGKAFNLEVDSSERDGSGRLVDVLYGQGVSAIVPVGSNAHWCVVCGVETDVDPRGGASYTIQGFYVNNPIPDLPHPHASNDNCGLGGSLGLQNQFVTYDAWQRYWFVGANFQGANSQFLSICDPSAPKFKVPTRVAPYRAYEGGGLVPSEKVASILETEFARYALYKNDKVNELAGKFAGPIRVCRLNRKEDYYHLTPAIKGDSVLGYAQTDGLLGNLLSVFSNKNAAAFELDSEKIAQELIGHEIELPKHQGGRSLKEGEFKVDPELVWRPCQESPSSHLPFWRIIVGARTFYRRIDGGKVLTRLTVGGLGA